jgi:antitoxin (DNA-binding transcriptional repressor) of toxin-antitoxin stability system
MDQVNEQHISITITKHGKAVARLVPIDETSMDSFGCLKNKITINGDITKSIEDVWEANQ